MSLFNKGDLLLPFLFPRQALVFMCLQYKSFENLLVKEKLLIMNDFSFSHTIFIRLVLQTRKNLGLFGRGSSLYNMTIFDRSKLKTFADKNVCQTLKFALRMVGKVGKMRKCWLPAFSPFPTIILKAVFLGS